MFNLPVPASATAAALVALLRGRAAPAFIDNGRPMGPGVAGRGVIF